MGEEGATPVELLDAVVARIRDVDVPAPVRRHAGGAVELSIVPSPLLSNFVPSRHRRDACAAQDRPHRVACNARRVPRRVGILACGKHSPSVALSFAAKEANWQKFRVSWSLL